MRAVPTSHGFGSTKQPLSCNFRKAARFCWIVRVMPSPIDQWILSSTSSTQAFGSATDRWLTESITDGYRRLVYDRLSFG